MALRLRNILMPVRTFATAAEESGAHGGNLVIFFFCDISLPVQIIGCVLSQIFSK